MAMPKKGRRTITVADLTFYWTVSRNSDFQHQTLHIQHAEYPAAKIDAQFDRMVHDLSITPDVVRQVVETALSSGWNPASATKPLYIPMAHKLYPDAVTQAF
jgi:hypothetical protein